MDSNHPGYDVAYGGPGGYDCDRWRTTGPG
jgi:hypothetical protein